jgi:bifunctional DNase/RNase
MGRVEMEVVSVQRDLYGSEAAFALILDEKKGHRRLKIIIAQAEAQAISMELERYTFRRPLTHDLLVSIIHALDAKVLELNIHKLEDNTFFAYLLLESATGQVLEIDCRPSDGVAIALKTRAPIYCEEHLLEIAGVPVEEDQEESEPSGLRGVTGSAASSRPPAILQQFIDMLLKGSPPSIDALLEKLTLLPPERKQELVTLLSKLMDEAIQKENYELAAQLRDIIQRLNKS